MKPSDSQDLHHGSRESPTALTTTRETKPSTAERDLHNSLPQTSPSIDDGKPSALRGSDGDDHGSPTSRQIIPNTTSSPTGDTGCYSSTPLTNLSISDKVACDKGDKMWNTEEEKNKWIVASVPAEANSIRADVKKLAVHQMLVLFHLHTDHNGDRCSGPGIQDWMLSILKCNLQQAYDDAFAHIRKEKEPDPNNEHGAFLNLWVRRTIKRRLRDAANKTVVEAIEAKTREGCTVDLESYEKMLLMWGVKNNSEAV